MKIAYYSTMAFTDCDFPLVRAYREAGEDVRYYIPILRDKLSGALINIKEQIPSHGILPAESYEEFRRYSSYLDMNGVYAVNRRRRGGHPLNILLYLRLLVQLIRWKPDVIHITHPLSGPELVLYLLARKMVLTVHDPFPHSGEAGGRKEKQRRLAFRIIPKFILLNDAQKVEFTRRYHIRGKVICNRLGAYEELRTLQTSREEGSGYILHFGRISPYKGIEHLCRAMDMVHSRIPELKCVIAGSGPLYFDPALIEGRDYISFQHRFIDTEELANLIAGARFCVCPYKDATQSGVIASAFAFCCPVIATDVGALRESIEDGITGVLLSDPGSKDFEERLSDAISTLWNSPQTVQKMREEIFRKWLAPDSESGRSWKEIAQKNIEEIYG